MSSHVPDESEPLLANPEALQRAAKSRRKKQIIICLSLVAVGVALVVAITVPLTKGKNQAEPNLSDDDDIPEATVKTYTDVDTLEGARFGENVACQVPPVASFNDTDLLFGLWYEIIKIQTPLAAIVQEGCSCSTMSIDESVNNETEQVETEQVLMRLRCRDSRVGNTIVGAIATMVPTEDEGSWIQFLFGTKTSWHVLFLDDTYLVTYECSVSYDNKIEYGIHLFAREALDNEITIPDDVQDVLRNASDTLNPLNVAQVMIDHSNCDTSQVDEEEVHIQGSSKFIPKLGPNLANPGSFDEEVKDIRDNLAKEVDKIKEGLKDHASDLATEVKGHVHEIVHKVHNALGHDLEKIEDTTGSLITEIKEGISEVVPTAVNANEISDDHTSGDLITEAKERVSEIVPTAVNDQGYEQRDHTSGNLITKAIEEVSGVIPTGREESDDDHTHGVLVTKIKKGLEDITVTVSNETE